MIPCLCRLISLCEAIALYAPASQKKVVPVPRLVKSPYVVVKEHYRAKPGEGRQEARRRPKKKRKRRGAVSYI